MPPYLLPEDKKSLWEELKGFPNDFTYYIGSDFYGDKILQGDAWGEINFFDPVSGNQKQVKGIVLSNTCDVSSDNERVVPMRVLFSPLLDFNKYIRIIAETKGEESARSTASAIKEQKKSNLMYFPPNNSIALETIASLDNIISLPRDKFLSSNTEKLFCLNQAGFYLFVIKLSVHLTRFQEGISRF